MSEIWKEVPKAPGYQISSLGRAIGKKGSFLKPLPSRKGYPEYRFYCGGRNKGFRIHRLVAEAFLPRIEGKNEVNHKDFDKTNNCIENLEWNSRKENMSHAIVGGHAGGAGAKRFACTEKVRECQSRYLAGETISSISRSVGISASSISEMIRGVSFGGKYQVKELVSRRSVSPAEVVRLRAETQKSFRKVGAMLGISESQAHRLYHSAVAS